MDPLLQSLMRSYLHTITRHQAYIEKLLLWIKIKQRDLETRIDHAPACICFVQKNRRGHCTFPLRITLPRQKKVTLSTKLDITWQAAPSQTWSITKPHKCCVATSTNVFLTKIFCRNYLAILEKGFWMALTIIQPTYIAIWMLINFS